MNWHEYKVRGLMVLTALASLAVTACSDHSQQPHADPAAAWFEDATDVAGIAFHHVSGHREGTYYIPEIVSGGAAVFDLNNNGFLDVYLVQAGSLYTEASERPGNRLYRNRGPEQPGVFQDITESSGAGDRGYGMGVAVGDIDNDGFIDVYVTNVGRNTLLRNNGDETFTDITDSAAVGCERFGASAAMLDDTLDGNLDIFVTNYLTWSPATEMTCYNELGSRDYCGPTNYRAPARDTLYRNNGDGSFTDVTEASGIAGHFGNGLGVACADFTGNGWIDIFVANDGNPDQLWANQGDGTFVDVALEFGCAVDQDGISKAGMGVAVADVNDNSRPDLLVCNLRGESDSFYLNQGSHFVDATGPVGLRGPSRAFTRFGMALLDFDNDGYLDLYQANGRVYREATMYGDDPYAEPNMVFRGGPHIRFEPVSLRGGVAGEHFGTSRAAAFGDLDNNGAIDVIVVNRHGPVQVLRNVVGANGNWIQFRVLNEHGRDAYNATVSVTIGERIVHRDVRSAYSYLAANDPRVHIGLGDVMKVRNVTVRWLDGQVDQFGEFDANQIVVLQRDDRGTSD